MIDDTKRLGTLRMPDDQYSPRARRSGRKVTLLTDRVVRILYRRCKWIPKNRNGFLEGHTVIRQIRGSLFWIPLELR